MEIWKYGSEKYLTGVYADIPDTRTITKQNCLFF